MSDASWMQDCVREFHIKMGQPAPERFTRLSPDRGNLRFLLIQEELVELDLALQAEDDLDAVDAICDLLYVVLGTAVEMGLPVERFFLEVHRSNMTKEPGNMREDGKILKGPEYEPPRLELMLERLKERGR